MAITQQSPFGLFAIDHLLSEEERMMRDQETYRETTEAVKRSMEDVVKQGAVVASVPPVAQDSTADDDATLLNLAGEAKREVIRQLQMPGNSERIVRPQWRQRFGKSLGPLRQFLEDHDEFIVKDGTGY